MQYPQSHILNIHYNTGILVLRALNKYHNHDAAAEALGISARNIFLLKIQYRIVYNHFKDVFEINLKPIAHATRKNSRAAAK